MLGAFAVSKHRFSGLPRLPEQFRRYRLQKPRCPISIWARKRHDVAPHRERGTHRRDTYTLVLLRGTCIFLAQVVDRFERVRVLVSCPKVLLHTSSAALSRMPISKLALIFSFSGFWKR